MQKTSKNKHAVQTYTQHYFWIVLSVVWAAFIFINSIIPGKQSSQSSQGITQILQDILIFLKINITVTELFIRKSAHFVEYMILGIFVSLAVFKKCKAKPLYIETKNTTRNKLLIQALPMIFCILMAVPITDEFIQLFVPGRAGMVQDIVLDIAGATTGCLVILVIQIVKIKNKNTKGSESCEQ